VSTNTFAEANEAELLKACELFAPGASFALSPTSGGVNNHVRYCDCDDGSRFVVRLYNNGQMTDRVAFEHAVLTAVGKHVQGNDLGFTVPKALKAKSGDDSTFAILPSGDAASVFELIPGTLPKTKFADAVGEATAVLSSCLKLAEEEVRAQFPKSPQHQYRNIFGSLMDKGGSKESFYEEMENNPGLQGAVKPAVDKLANMIRDLESKLVEIERSGGLPETLLHGDVHYDNALCDHQTGKVTGIIDFEFAVFDWRFMEAAVGLSKYVGEKDPMPMVVDYLRGFLGRADWVTEKEIDALPDLIKLRVLETVVYFVARAVSGEDDISQLSLRAENYAARVTWIEENAEAIRQAARDGAANR
jgi:homoserine kinase type II